MNITYIIVLIFAIVGLLLVMNKKWLNDLKHPSMNPPFWLTGAIISLMFILINISFSLGKEKIGSVGDFSMYGFLISILLWAFLFYAVKKPWISEIALWFSLGFLLTVMSIFGVFNKTLTYALLLVPVALWIVYSISTSRGFVMLNA